MIGQSGLTILIPGYLLTLYLLMQLINGQTNKGLVDRSDCRTEHLNQI